jgi:hypothetical protein
MRHLLSPLPFVVVACLCPTLSAQRVVRELFGTEIAAEFGSHIVRTPDGNSDGRADLLIGVPRLTNGSQLNAGGAVLIATSTGATFGSFVGTSGGARLGTSVCCPGDLDGDGTLDAVLGAPLANSAAGLVRAFRGDGTTLWTRTGIAWTYLGTALAPLGDVDGDGLPDVAVSAPGTRFGVVYGDVGACAGTTGAALTSVGGSPFGEWGTAVVTLSDVDGDGRADFASSEPDYAGGIGRISLVRTGASGGPAVLWTTGSVFAAGENVGAVMGNAGDLTGDGKDDLLASSTFGRVHVIDGANGARLGTIDHWVYANATSLGSIGDQNGDGRPEIAIGQSGYNAQTGRVAVHDGATWNLLFLIDGQSGSRFGHSLARLDDLDGDGRPEFAVGAPLHNNAGLQVGRVSVHGLSVPSRIASYGSGCGGSAGVLALVGSGQPIPGQGFTFTATNLPANCLGLWFYGTSRTNSPFGALPVDLGPLGYSGCWLHQDMVASAVFATLTSPSATRATPVPNNQSLVGFALFAQVALLDPSAAGGLATSNGVEVRIGNL